MNCRGLYGSMPLILAAGNGHYECVSSLLQAGVLINKTTNLGHSALAMYIIRHSPPEEDMVMLLYAAGETLRGVNKTKIPQCLKQEGATRRPEAPVQAGNTRSHD